LKSFYDYDELGTQLLLTIGKNKTQKTKILNPPNKEWISKKILDLINTRNQLSRKLKQAPDDQVLKNKFIQIRNDTHMYIQSSKSNYYHKVFTNCQSDPLKMWQLIKTKHLQTIKTKNKIIIPPKIDTPYGQITEPKQICEYFNTFFATIGNELAKNIPQKYHNNLTYTVNKPKNNNIELTLIEETTIQEIAKIINKLDTNTSVGLDGISTKCFKSVKNEA
jgi:hypothetical protein